MHCARTGQQVQPFHRAFPDISVVRSRSHLPAIVAPTLRNKRMVKQVQLIGCTLPAEHTGSQGRCNQLVVPSQYNVRRLPVHAMHDARTGQQVRSIHRAFPAESCLGLVFLLGNAPI